MYLLVQGFLVNGLINIVLVALETRFGMSSSRSAVIVSSHDFGAVLFIVIVGYFGEKCHKPRVMASGIFLMSLGSFLFALPHFISEPYQYTVSGSSNSSANICNERNSSSALQHETSNGSYTLYYGIMILGSLLLGIGHVPTFVLGLGYIDENSEARDSAFHMGLSPSDPQWVGAWWLGVLVACFMFFLVAFPIFGYPRHLPDDSSSSTVENVCNINPSNSSSCASAADDASSNDGYYALLIIGQCLLGIGAVPMFTVGLTYIDENSRTRDSAFHIGFSFCSAAVGVAIGYIAGGQTLTLFVDIDKVDTDSIPLKPTDPQWVGAWWIGIVVGLFTFVLVALPMLAYPRRLPNYEKLQKEKKSETHGSAEDKMPLTGGFGKSIKEFPKALFRLFKNPAYVFIVLGGTVEIFIVGGLATFGAKLFQEFHNVPLVEAGFIMGMITIPGSGGGMLLGGWLIKRFNLRVRGIIRLSCGCIFICMLFGPAFLASCVDYEVAGVGHPYVNETAISMTSECNKGCGCTTSGYEPVCDHDNVVYFSPCHAGCSNVRNVNGSKVYEYCVCISPSTDGGNPSVTGGTCTTPGKCPWFYVFSVFIFLMMLFTFTTTSPILQAMFRCVPHNQRSFGLGIQLLFGRLLGTTPGPIFLGAIIDSSCDVWQETCGSRGNCWLYRKWDLGVKVMLWWMGTKFVGVILLFIASKVYKPPKDLDMDITVDPKDDKRGQDNPVFSIDTKSDHLDNSNGYFTKL
ncbi:hypothetical protein FSP39_009291 [Pinctada imbricata]|uniref:Solute carrier organic anion transporter family member n=1 Tax=Pinctada imbricata TaxID=66713 RepID=A0AA89BRL7_PINIB|nr:hypothetical protein FSP39_009291 [Pinctada imbricata]